MMFFPHDVEGNYESHNSAIKNSQQFKINCAIEINDSFHDRMHEREEIRKSTSKYFNAFKFLDKSLVFITCYWNCNSFIIYIICNYSS